MYSSAARVHVGESGQDQGEQGYVGFLPTKLSKTKVYCTHPKNRRESYIRFQGLACAPEKGALVVELGSLGLCQAKL